MTAVCSTVLPYLSTWWRSLFLSELSAMKKKADVFLCSTARWKTVSFVGVSMSNDLGALSENSFRIGTEHFMAAKCKGVKPALLTLSASLSSNSSSTFVISRLLALHA